MSEQDHLMLRLVRLKANEQVEQNGNGLTFFFAKGGVGKFVSKLSTYRFYPGDIFVTNCATPAKVGAHDNNGEFVFWSFSICFENLLPLFAGNEISLLRKIAESFKAGKTYPANSSLAMECHRLLGVVPPQYNLDHRGQLVRIAATVLSSEFKGALTEKGGRFQPENHMVQVFEKLSSAELINLSVGELADRFSCSRRHLNRLFHQHFGVSVAALRMEMRLLKAVSLLRDPEAKIINVAEECGFNHLGLFNTCFKRRFGTSPGQWRRSSTQKVSGAVAKRGDKSLCPLHDSGLCPMNDTNCISPPALVKACAEKVLEEEDEPGASKHFNVIFGAISAQQAGQPSTEEGEARC